MWKYRYNIIQPNPILYLYLYSTIGYSIFIVPVLQKPDIIQYKFQSDRYLGADNTTAKIPANFIIVNITIVSPGNPNSTEVSTFIYIFIDILYGFNTFRNLEINIVIIF